MDTVTRDYEEKHVVNHGSVVRKKIWAHSLCDNPWMEVRCIYEDTFIYNVKAQTAKRKIQ